jgi:hypothetical protein
MIDLLVKRGWAKNANEAWQMTELDYTYCLIFNNRENYFEDKK